MLGRFGDVNFNGRNILLVVERSNYPIHYRNNCRNIYCSSNKCIGLSECGKYRNNYNS